MVPQSILAVDKLSLDPAANHSKH